MLVGCLGCGVGHGTPVPRLVERVRLTPDGRVAVSYSVGGVSRTRVLVEGRWLEPGGPTRNRPELPGELGETSLGILCDAVVMGERGLALRDTDGTLVHFLESPWHMEAVHAEILVHPASERGVRGLVTECPEGERSWEACFQYGFAIDAGGFRRRATHYPAFAGPMVIAHATDFLLGGVVESNQILLRSLEGPEGATIWPPLELPPSEHPRTLLAVTVVPIWVVFTDASPDLGPGRYVRVMDYDRAREAWADVTSPRPFDGPVAATDVPGGFVLATSTRTGIEVVELVQRAWVPYGPPLD